MLASNSIHTALLRHIARLERAGLHDLVAEARDIAADVSQIEAAVDERVSDAADDERERPTATHSCVPRRVVRSAQILQWPRHPVAHTVPVYAVGDRV